MTLAWGVDVSGFQADQASRTLINWDALAAEGCRFVIVKLGQRTIEPSAASHAAAARAAGLTVAGYFWGYDDTDPAAEAARWWQVARDIGCTTYGVDFEHNANPRLSSFQSGRHRVWYPAVIEAMESHVGTGRALHYAGWYVVHDDLGGVHPAMARNIWWGQVGWNYSDVLTPTQAIELYPRRNQPEAFDFPGMPMLIGQMTEHGRVASYRGDLDINVCDEATLVRIAGTPTPRPTMTAPDRIIAEARRWVGTTEQGNNNVPGITDRWGVTGQPWCAAYVNTVYENAGMPLPVQSMYCPTLVAAAYDRGEAVPLTEGQAGDIVLFSWPDYPWRLEGGRPVIRGSGTGYDGTPPGDHVGLIAGPFDGAGYPTIEGNTSPGDGGSQTNGGGVWERWRALPLICTIWRPAALRNDDTFAAASDTLTPIITVEEDDMFSDQDRAQLDALFKALGQPQRLNSELHDGVAGYEWMHGTIVSLVHNQGLVDAIATAAARKVIEQLRPAVPAPAVPSLQIAGVETR